MRGLVVREGVGVRLGYEGRRVTIVLPEEIGARSLGEILRFLIETAQEVEAADDYETWRARREAIGADVWGGRATYRTAVRRARRIRRLLGRDLERFAAAE